MSATLSTANMVGRLLQRCRFGVRLGVAEGLDLLNSSYRWIDRQGPFVWKLKSASVSVAQSTNTFPLPYDCDFGRPMFLSGPSAQSMLVEIPYMAPEAILNTQFSDNTVGPGMWSAWTIMSNFATGSALFTNGIATATGVGFPAANAWGSLTLVTPVASATISSQTTTVITLSGNWTGVTGTYAFTVLPYTYNGVLYPIGAQLASGAMTQVLVYHAVTSPPLVMSPNVYFPTPDAFDDVIMDLAEAEWKRRSRVPGADVAQAKAQASVVSLLDQYRSTKLDLAGMADKERQAKEKELQRAEG